MLGKKGAQEKGKKKVRKSKKKKKKELSHMSGW